MSVPVIAFFNSKSPEKISLVCHVACMLAEQGYRVVAADLDPHSDLTIQFLDEERLEELWSDSSSASTIYSAVHSASHGRGAIGDLVLERISDRLALVPGNISFGEFEGALSQAWAECLAGNEQAFRLLSSLWKVIRHAATLHCADVVLVDIAPNLGAINRAVLVASDFVVIPVVADMFSVQGLRSLGGAIRSWRSGWRERSAKASDSSHPLPKGKMRPMGYVVSPGHPYRYRPNRAYATWLDRLPTAYRKFVLGSDESLSVPAADDPHCIGVLRHYRSLVPMAEEARRPMFSLKAADGAMGALMHVVQDAYADFKKLSLEIAERAHVQHGQAGKATASRKS